MSQISKFLRSQGDGGLMYWCQGCSRAHVIKVGDGAGPRWGYNGNPEKPTFSPSVLVRGGHYSDLHKQGDECWCTYNAEHPDDVTFVCQRCHTFITDGRVQFLSDCSHALAGQTLDLPELPRHLQDGAS